jgi:hypothetical protein
MRIRAWNSNPTVLYRNNTAPRYVSEGGAGAKRKSLGPKVIGAAVGSFQILEE